MVQQVIRKPAWRVAIRQRMLHGATAHLASTPHDRFRVLETGLRRVLRIPNSRDTDGTRCVFQQGKDNGLDKGSNRVDLAVACIAPRANRRFVALRLAARQDCGASLNI